jgi:lipoprotein-releasing system ATP-binding protein
MLRTEALVKAYPGVGGPAVPVLQGADLAVAGGEMVAVMGGSGSGKSTLLNVLGLLEPADAGEIWLEGARVSGLPRRAQARVRGRRIGYVFQSFLLIESLTAIENVLLAARYVGRDRREAERAARRLMARLDVAHRLDHHPAQLSGGEQQRVAFCRAVLNEPPLLLADEPTGNLDEGHAAVILGELRRQADERGAAVVLVTHRADAAARADRCLRLQAGRLEPVRAPTAAPGRTG